MLKKLVEPCRSNNKEKRLVGLENRRRIKTIQTTALFKKIARILRRVLETCCHPVFS